MFATYDSNTKADYEAQLAAGFPLLQFRDPLESEFRQHRVHQNMRLLRLALGIGFVFGLCFLALDFVLGKGQLSDPAVWQRTLVTQTLVAMMLVATYRPAAWRWLSAFAVAIALSIAGGNLLMASVGEARNLGSIFIGMVVVTFYTYLFVGLRFWPALATALAVLAGTVAHMILTDAPTATVLYNAMFLIFANLIGASGLYTLEYNQRMSYLESRLLAKMATIDPLTELANRDHFNDYLDRTWRQCLRDEQPLTVALIDIDHFKTFNDRYGHQAGDRCLVSVAETIDNACRRPLDLAGRYGGEEFIFVMPGARCDHAHVALSRILSNIEALNIPHEGSPTASRVTASAGVAHLYPHDTDRSVQGLLQMADEALYTAKSKGRNRVSLVQPDREASMLTGVFSRTADGELAQMA